MPETAVPPYSTVIHWSEDDGAYRASHPELPGCVAYGDSKEEALEVLADFTDSWLALAREVGRPVPRPVESNYSGRLTLRLPRSLHRAVADRAAIEDVSINMLIVHLLSLAMGPANRMPEHLHVVNLYGLDSRTDADAELWAPSGPLSRLLAGGEALGRR